MSTTQASDRPPPALSTHQQPEPPEDKYIRIGLYVVAGFCILAAIVRIFWPASVDQTTAMLLALAAVVLIIREISEAEIFGVKFKTRQRLREAEKRMDAIESAGGLPGRPAGGSPPEEGPPPIGAAPPTPATPPPRTRKTERTTPADGWNADPNKGKFGGSPAANGRVLEATIEPTVGESSAACRVVIRVRSTDPQAHPLTGSVKFHLHPTFGKWAEYTVAVKDGVAEDEITSWGAFTIGAEADGGQTKLELDLMSVRGGTRKFYAA